MAWSPWACSAATVAAEFNIPSMSNTTGAGADEPLGRTSFVPMSVAELRSRGWSISHCQGRTPVGGCHHEPLLLGAGACVVVVTGTVVDVGWDVVVVGVGAGSVVVVDAGTVVVGDNVVVVVTIGEKMRSVVVEDDGRSAVGVVVVATGALRTGAVVVVPFRGRVVVVVGLRCRQFELRTTR